MVYTLKDLTDFEVLEEKGLPLTSVLPFRPQLEFSLFFRSQYFLKKVNNLKKKASLCVPAWILFQAYWTFFRRFPSWKKGLPDKWTNNHTYPYMRVTPLSLIITHVVLTLKNKADDFFEKFVKSQRFKINAHFLEHLKMWISWKNENVGVILE